MCGTGVEAGGLPHAFEVLSDGAPAHTSMKVKEFLVENFGENLIEQEGGHIQHHL
ncbi:hypothetical protein B4U80_03962 [Leptotrombidium deliense]|uniref:Uncharacterized protein n=1 Tax=Leptotrombidium deliense TaxID=299467 RepID=A0A443RVF4_9ACAR|nr:hypothetical protein B4U80_03962 [Leptotrombidium deliense]